MWRLTTLLRSPRRPAELSRGGAIFDLGARRAVRAHQQRSWRAPRVGKAMRHVEQVCAADEFTGSSQFAPLGPRRRRIYLLLTTSTDRAAAERVRTRQSPPPPPPPLVIMKSRFPVNDRNGRLASHSRMGLSPPTVSTSRQPTTDQMLSQSWQCTLHS